MKNNISAFVVGFIFAIGLGISGMTQPLKIYSFLNIFGEWDASLLFVMIAAVSIHFILFRLVRRRRTPLFSNRWYLPENSEITKNLVIGSILFGVGWGMGGYCPGPGIVALASGQVRPWIFVGFMFVGMFTFKLLDKKFHFRR